MAEKEVRVDNGSPERVAYELWYILRQRLPMSGKGDPEKIKLDIDLYAQCLKATKGGAYNLDALT